jgi:hypothetical protein
MMKTTKFTWLAITIFLISLSQLAGCKALQGYELTPTLTFYPTIRPPKPTRTPTLTQTPTLLPSNTPTISPTLTFLPPIDDFSEARLYASGPIPGWDFSLTILLPEPIKGEYNALVGNPAKHFTCRPLLEYGHPDRLYCSGRIPNALRDVEYKIIEKNSGQTVFEGIVYIPVP